MQVRAQRNARRAYPADPVRLRDALPGFHADFRQVAVERVDRPAVRQHDVVLNHHQIAVKVQHRAKLKLVVRTGVVDRPTSNRQNRRALRILDVDSVMRRQPAVIGRAIGVGARRKNLYDVIWVARERSPEDIVIDHLARDVETRRRAGDGGRWRISGRGVLVGGATKAGVAFCAPSWRGGVASAGRMAPANNRLSAARLTSSAARQFFRCVTVTILNPLPINDDYDVDAMPARSSARAIAESRRARACATSAVLSSV